MTAHAHNLADPRARALRSVPSPLPTVKLSTRQWQILALIAAGRSRKEIADRLDVSVDTVKSTAYAVYKKLGARNAAHAVHLAQREGLFNQFNGRRLR